MSRALIATACLLALGGKGWAQSDAVSLVGTIGQRAILSVGGGAPKTIGAGDTHGGVALIRVSGQDALVKLPSGAQVTLRVGDSPISLGAKASASPAGSTARVVLSADSRGHFLADGQINGKSVRFMVDTGATSVALGLATAQRMGLDLNKGQRVSMGTANGVVQGLALKLDQVRLGAVDLYAVDAVIVPLDMPYALLGNAVLNRFSMKREGDVMVLDKRF
jgi:aspartyl protease family protein